MTLEELKTLLVRLQLVQPGPLESIQSRACPDTDDANVLLQALENSHLLTSYQVGKLGRGESDALVLGDYKLLYRNAAGSFARVYRGASLTDGRMVGLKVLRQRWAADPRIVRLFRREADLGKKLNHEKIVPIYDVASQGDSHYFTMEFVEGGNLRDFLNIRKRLSVIEATRCLMDMAEGLEYAARMGVTHRDLKLTNVLMSTQGIAKLVDFGLAGDEVMNSEAGGDSLQRALEYATLERGTNAPPNDPRSDLYFLGGIYYELLTGVPPYPRTHSREERRQFSRYASLRPIRSVDPNIPKSVADIVERLMKTNPDQRYQSAAMVRSDAQEVLFELERPTKPANATMPEEGTNGSKVLPTILFIEHRLKQQDIIRDYLSKRGFRVLLFNNVHRAISRLQSNPPDCVVLIGDSIGDDLAGAYEQVRELNGDRFIHIAVLAERQADLVEKLEQTALSRVMQQPITLRELRREIHLLFQRKMKTNGRPSLSS
ncbi:MAG TPA: serine/threonine-protein kinase [Planctomycetaceae bacterium]|jgi:serine/threonine protein kinase|nr:serine/threonine-protein kinase [Planctomycetaceae bacterium]